MSPAIRIALVLCVVFSCVVFTGCRKQTEPLPIMDIKKDYDRPLPPGEFALRHLTDTSQYPNFADAWYRAKSPNLRKAIEHSLDYLDKPSSRSYFPLGPITHAKAKSSLTLFLSIIEESPSPEALNDAIRENFDVYISVGCDDAGTVLFTGYYSPIFDGSLTQTEHFRYPLYRLPPGFEKDALGNPVDGAWHTREEIETSNMLDGNEIVWLGDRFESYVISVQGSGFIRLPDESLFEIGYAGHNGHEYTPVGRMLVADGKLDRHKLSLDSMIRHFRENPLEMDEYLFQNKRYIFFREADGGPYGCLGQPVTKFHSVATDKDIFPRACLTFVDTQIPRLPSGDLRTFRCFTLDQDRGAAIRAPGRCDIYMGVGDKAGRMAGFTYSEGKLYYLIAKDGLLADEPGGAGFDEDGEESDQAFGRQR